MSESTDLEFIARLRALALDYDRANGTYVESQFQGYDVFEWIRTKLLSLPSDVDESDWITELGPDVF